MNEPKKIYRIEKGACLAGVCGGVAEYFNIDANLVRLIWAIITPFTCFASCIIYLIAAVILPKKSDIYPGY